MLVVMTGLPCTFKSTIPRAVARELDAPVVSADPIDAALAAAGVPNTEGRVGYEVMKALAATELGSGRSVVIDAVNPFAFVRHAYFDLASAAGCQVRVIVTTWGDEAVHRERVSRRTGEGMLDWREVERQRAYYEPYRGEALHLDAGEAANLNCMRAITYTAQDDQGR